LCAPLGYFYGGLSPGDNSKLYKRQVTTLAQTLEQRIALDEKGIISFSNFVLRIFFLI